MNWLESHMEKHSVTVPSLAVAVAVCDRANAAAYKHANRVWPGRFSHGVFFDVEQIVTGGDVQHKVVPTSFEACHIAKKFDVLNDAVRYCGDTATNRSAE